MISFNNQSCLDRLHFDLKRDTMILSGAQRIIRFLSSHLPYISLFIQS